MPRRKQRRDGAQLKLLDDDLRGRLLSAIQSGVPYKHAAEHAGITDRTIFRWLSEGEAAQEDMDAGQRLEPEREARRQFWVDVRKARAGVAVRNLELAQEAAVGGQLIRRRTLPNGVVEEEFAPIDWRAAKWLVEASFPGEFAAARQLEVSGQVGVGVSADESIRRVSERLAEALARSDEDDIVDAEVVGERPALGVGHAVPGADPAA